MLLLSLETRCNDDFRACCVTVALRGRRSKHRAPARMGRSFPQACMSTRDTSIDVWRERHNTTA